MGVNCNVYFSSIEFLTPYTSIIYGNSAQFGSSSDFKIEYTGADLIQKNGYIPEIVLPLLKEDLNNLLGYGPFDKKKINRNFKSIKVLTYYISGESISRVK